MLPIFQVFRTVRGLQFGKIPPHYVNFDPLGHVPFFRQLHHRDKSHE